MAGNRDIHGDVILDVELSGEERAKARLQEQFAKMTANVNVNIKLPLKREMQASLDKRVGAGLKLKIASLEMPSRKAMQLQLDTEAQKGGGIKLFIDELNLPVKKEMQAQLDTRVGPRGLKLKVHLELNRESLVPVIAQQRAVQRAISDIEAKEAAKRETFRIREAERRLSQDNSALRRKEINEDVFARRALDRETVLAQRSEIIQQQLNARLAAQDNQFRQRQIFAAERAQRQLQARASKPILQQIFIDASKLNASLADFDRTVSRALRTSLIAFTVWSGGVAAATAAAAGAALVSFGKIEIAATQTSSVIAAQTISDEFIAQGRAVSDFSTIVDESFDKVIEKADEVALETLFDTGDIIGSIDAAVKAGQDLESAMSTVAASANFAQVNQLDAAEASDKLAAGLAAAGLQAEGAAGLIDKISFTAASALGEADDYLTAFANRAAASAQAFGYTNDEVLVFLSLLGQTGTLGREAGTQANIVFRELGRAAGRASEAWRKYGLDANGSLNEQLVGLAKVAAEVEKTQGRAGVAGLAAELGLTYRSISSILQVLPQVNREGLTGLNNLQRGIANSQGLVDQQAEQIRDNIAFQWDNLLNTTAIAARKFGEQLSPAMSELFDVFGGEGGLINQAEDNLAGFGVAFADVVDDVTRYVQTDAFRSAIATLVEAVDVTLGGVADTFEAFSSAFDDAQGSQSTFESIADSILAFSQVSAAVLPKVAKILGEIFDFLIDNADSFETFAKITIAVYAMRKAFTLLLNPLYIVVSSMLEFRGAIIAAATAGSSAGFVGMLGGIATRMGVVTASTQAATAATLELAAAQIAASRGAMSVTGAAALGVIPGFAGRGFNRNANRRRAIGDAGRAGVGALGEGAAIASAALAARNAAAFDRISDSLATSTSRARTFTSAAGKATLATAALAAAVPITTGLIDGFSSSMKDARLESEELDSALGMLGDGFAKLDEKLGQGGRKFGEYLADITLDSLKLIADVDHLIRSGGTSTREGAERTERREESQRRLNAQMTEGLNITSSYGRVTRDAGYSLAELNVLTATSASEISRQNNIIAQIGSTSTLAFEQSANAMRLGATGLNDVETAAEGVIGKNRTLAGVTGGFAPVFASASNTAVNAIGAIGSATTTVTAQLLGMQAAMQAAVGEQKNFDNSIIMSGLQSQLAQARLGEGAFSVAEVEAMIAAQKEFERQQALIAGAKRARSDAKIYADAYGDEIDPVASIDTLAAASPRIPSPAQREFVDPDEILQQQIARLKPLQKVAQVSAVIDRATAKQGEAYQLTRRETLLLADAQPRLDRALEKQRGIVAKLDEALSNLRNTQIAGTQAFSDQAFAIDQQIKQLQLNRLDALGAGNTEGSQVVIDIDNQIKALQTQAERVSLTESLQLDPLRRDLEKTFNPVAEDSFENIVAQFNALNASRETQNAKLVAQEATQARLNSLLETARVKYDAIDAASQRSVEAFNKAQQAAAQTATQLSSVGSSAAAGARSVNSYSTAVENVPTGKGVVDKSLKGINDRVKELEPQFTGSGKRVMTIFTQGVNRGFQETTVPAFARITAQLPGMLKPDAGEAEAIAEVGGGLMYTFYKGLVSGFGLGEGGKLDEGRKNTPAYFLNKFIPQWIMDNKGPISYDRTILAPAGNAIMEGLGSGLRQGFSQVQDFIGGVGPSIKEVISGADFSTRLAPIMADIALGKTPDIHSAFSDLSAAGIGNVPVPYDVDPSLSFLHRTMSLKDTTQQAFAIVRALGGGLNTGGSGQLLRPGDSDSAHSLGIAADIGTGGPNPTPASLHLFEQAKKLLGSVFRQVIHNGIGLTAGGGTFPDPNHDNHVHLEFIKALGFSLNSGKIGSPPSIDFPGASDIVDQAITQAARGAKIDPLLFGALVKAESGFNPNAGSGAGARGLSQLMPATAQALGVRSILDPFDNARGGAKYLRQQLDAFKSTRLALAAYNAGPGAVRQYKGVPPYPETQAYIPRVLGYFEEFKKLFGGFREMGGSVTPGKAYVVGEKRPEIFVPKTAGTILPDAAATLSGSGGAGGGVVYHDNRTFNTEVATNASDAQAAADAFEARMRSRLTGVNFRR